MSYIPNKAMPHAMADEPEAETPAWQAQFETLRDQAIEKAKEVYEMARARPVEVAGGAAVLLLTLASAGWARRRSRRHAF